MLNVDVGGLRRSRLRATVLLSTAAALAVLGPAACGSDGGPSDPDDDGPPPALASLLITPEVPVIATGGDVVDFARGEGFGPSSLEVDASHVYGVTNAGGSGVAGGRVPSAGGSVDTLARCTTSARPARTRIGRPACGRSRPRAAPPN